MNIVTPVDDMENTPEDACVNWERCHNLVPHNGQMCGECLDEARAEDRNDYV